MAPASKKKSSKSLLARFDSNLWHFHLPVPVEMAEPFITGNDRRVVCTLNGVTSFQCALMPDGNGAYFVLVNKKLRDKLKLQDGDQVTYTLEKDTSEYGLPMPEEFKELLKQDRAGEKFFHALTPGKQRTLLYIAGTPKSSDIRIHKAICILEHLKATKGKINYKALNELFKQSR